MIVAVFTVTGAVPVELKVSVCVVDVFIVTSPKLKLPALTVSCGLGTATLVPLSTIVVVPPVDELLLMINSPFATPVVIGLNWTCSVSDWFGLSVAGRLPPTKAKPVPLIAAEFTVTGAVPVELKVSV